MLPAADQVPEGMLKQFRLTAATLPADIRVTMQQAKRQADGVAGGVKAENYFLCGTAHQRLLHLNRVPRVAL